jgi:hypothetical protein
MYNKMDMLVQFPNMVIQNLEGTKYDGYINVMVTMVFICLASVGHLGSVIFSV